MGITREIAQAIFQRAKVDVITLGNHAWGKREAYSYLDEELRILRPTNYPPGVPGRGYALYASAKGPVGVAVFQEQVAEHLHDRLLAGREHEKAGPHRGE